jgi:hypothetical protein
MNFREPRSGLSDAPRGLACLADEVGEADSMVGVANEVKSGKAASEIGELCHAIEMANCVLRQRMRPAPYEGNIRLGQGPESLRQALECERDEVSVTAAQKRGSAISPEEGAEKDGTIGRSVSELLIDECAGQELGLGVWRCV